MYELTGPNAMFEREDRHQKYFEDLKTAMIDAVTLPIPNLNNTFVLDTDASDLSVGAELSQIQDGQEGIVAFGSSVLSPQQGKYCTTQRELLAVMTFTQWY